MAGVQHRRNADAEEVQTERSSPEFEVLAMASLMWRVHDRCRPESHIMGKHVDVENRSESAYKERASMSRIIRDRSLSAGSESRDRRVEVDPTIKIVGHGSIVCGSPDYVTRKRSSSKKTVKRRREEGRNTVTRAE